MQDLEQERQGALLAESELDDPKIWRFQPRFENGQLVGGVYLSRKLLQVSNTKLFDIFEQQGLRLAKHDELLQSLTAFGPNGYKERKFTQPWGLEPFWQANRLFVETGIAINGILYGASPFGCWAVVDGGGITLRQGASWNVGIFDDFLNKNGKMMIPTSEMTQALIDASRQRLDTEYADTPQPARNAGYGAGLELEDNEAYLLAKEATSEQVALMQKLIAIQGNKLNADSGLPCFSIPSIAEGELVVYFAAGGGCSKCNRLEVTTTKTFNADVQAGITKRDLQQFGYDAESMRIELLPEYQNWRENKMSDTLLSLAYDAIL